MKNIFGYTFQKLQKGGSLFKDNSSNVTKLKSLISKIEKGELPVSNPNDVKNKLQEIISFQGGGISTKLAGKSRYKEGNKTYSFQDSQYNVNDKNVANTYNGINSNEANTSQGLSGANKLDQYGRRVNTSQTGQGVNMTDRLAQERMEFNNMIGQGKQQDALAKYKVNEKNQVLDSTGKYEIGRRNIQEDTEPKTKKFSTNSTITIVSGVREDGTPNYNSQGLHGVLTTTGTDGKTTSKKLAYSHPEMQAFINSQPGHIKDLVNKTHNLDPMKHKALISSGAAASGASGAFKRENQ